MTLTVGDRAIRVVVDVNIRSGSAEPCRCALRDLDERCDRLDEVQPNGAIRVHTLRECWTIPRIGRGK